MELKEGVYRPVNKAEFEKEAGRIEEEMEKNVYIGLLRIKKEIKIAESTMYVLREQREYISK